MRSASDKRFPYASVALFLGGLSWVFSFFLPVFHTAGGSIDGYWVFISGWMGVVVFQFAWLANLLIPAAVILMHRAPIWAALIASLALLVATQAFWFEFIPDSVHSIPVTGLGEGFWFWYASMVLMGIGVFFGADEVEPQGRETYRMEDVLEPGDDPVAASVSVQKKPEKVQEPIWAAAVDTHSVSRGQSTAVGAVPEQAGIDPLVDEAVFPATVAPVSSVSAAVPDEEVEAVFPVTAAPSGSASVVDRSVMAQHVVTPDQAVDETLKTSSAEMITPVERVADEIPELPSVEVSAPAERVVDEIPELPSVEVSAPAERVADEALETPPVEVSAAAGSVRDEAVTVTEEPVLEDVLSGKTVAAGTDADDSLVPDVAAVTAGPAVSDSLPDAAVITAGPVVNDGSSSNVDDSPVSEDTTVAMTDAGPGVDGGYLLDESLPEEQVAEAVLNGDDPLPEVMLADDGPESDKVDETADEAAVLTTGPVSVQQGHDPLPEPRLVMADLERRLREADRQYFLRQEQARKKAGTEPAASSDPNT
ncbi:MAG TPA: hypothetical protein PLB10_06475 [Thiolinea sp.]|nr:hypothetical protein [Thiolinea sp.]